MANMISEYHVYADHKARLWDEILLEFFDEQTAVSAVLEECLPADGVLPKAILAQPLEKPVVIVGADMENAAPFEGKWFPEAMIRT
jgi:hypothetical protein